MKSEKITDNQKAWLEARNIQPPPTKAAASRLIGYIKNGNGTSGAKDPAGRLASLQKAQEKWIGKRVSIPHLNNEEGIVLFLSAKTFNDVEDLAELVMHPAPFWAHIKINKGNRARKSLWGLKLI